MPQRGNPQLRPPPVRHGSPLSPAVRPPTTGGGRRRPPCRRLDGGRAEPSRWFGRGVLTVARAAAGRGDDALDRSWTDREWKHAQTGGRCRKVNSLVRHGFRRILAGQKVQERCLHTAEVVGSSPAAPTGPEIWQRGRSEAWVIVARHLGVPTPARRLAQCPFAQSGTDAARHVGASSLQIRRVALHSVWWKVAGVGGADETHQTRYSHCPLTAAPM